MRYQIHLRVVMALATCTVLHPQDAGESGASAAPAMALFSGERQLPSYSGQTAPGTLAWCDFGYGTAYNDNPLATKASATGDWEQNAFGHMAVVHRSERLNALIDYRPYYRSFRRYDQFNRFNQDLSVDFLGRLNGQWSARLRDDFADQSSLYSSPARSSDALGIDSPTSLNSTIYAPLGNQRSNTLRLDVEYQKDLRNKLGLFATSARRTFDRTDPPLFGTDSISFGGEYNWRSTEHTTVGVLALENQIDISGHVPADGSTRMVSRGFFAAAGWAATPVWGFSGFFGPQVIQQRYRQDPASLPRDTSAQWKWAGGGAITGHTRRAALLVSAQHVVSDGGGLVNFVASTEVRVEYRRRLPKRWELGIDCVAARNTWIPVQTASGNLKALNADLFLSRAIHDRLFFDFESSYLRQISTGAIATNQDFHRNRIAIGISWHWQLIGAGR